MILLNDYPPSALDQIVGASNNGIMARALTLSENLRKALAECGETVYAVAKETGIPMSTLHRFKHGEGSLRLANADVLADYLGVRLVPDQRRKR